MDLQGKVIVITGASRGLGSVLAQKFLGEGTHVVVGSRTDPSLRHALWVQCDVTDEEQVQALAGAAMQKHGRIDVWISNAGVRIPHGPVTVVDMQRFHEMMEVNLFGVVYGAKAAVERMHEGIIISILSTSALEGRANSTAYGASKFAAMGFSKALRQEVKPRITVINVYPGGMKTEFFNEQMPADYDRYMDPAYVAEKIIANLKQDIPEEELIIRRPNA